MSYTKLFSSIVTSTIWTENSDTCKVWVTMLAVANKHGEVHAAIPGLAQIAGLTVEVVESSIEKFLAPDKYSRTPDDEGRRIEAIEGGWLLLNHAKYRAMASKDEEKTASAKRQQAFRARQKRNGKVTNSNGSVTVCNDAVTVDRDIAEAEADTNKIIIPKTNNKERAVALVLPYDSSDFKLFWANWEQHRKETKKPITPTSRKQQFAKLAEMGERRAIEALKHSLAGGYAGIYEPSTLKPNGTTHNDRHHGETEILEIPML